MESGEAGRIKTTNNERYELSRAYGWEFSPDAPNLLTRWTVLPFSLQGDQRLAFGALNGAYQGLPFTMFDYHRRPTVTSVHTRWTNKKINEIDKLAIESVWVVTLPVLMPNFQIVSSVESTFEITAYPDVRTPDPKFNRWYKLIDTDPNVAAHVLTPQVMGAMRQLKVHTWSLVGNELVYVQHPFSRNKPDDVLKWLGKLAALVAVLPLHLGRPQHAPQYPAPQYPPQPGPRYGYPPQPPRGY